jgi:hypothetical protein
MRSHYRAIAFAISLGAATLAAGQANNPSSNPVGRSPGGEVHFYNPWAAQQRGQVLGRSVLDNTGIGRPNPRGNVQVTPVPEPSQWAMMLAGLALVGFIVRRSSRRDTES